MIMSSIYTLIGLTSVLEADGPQIVAIGGVFGDESRLVLVSSELSDLL